MKHILLLLVLLLVLPVAVYPTIVTNTASTSQDSICMFVNCLDSAGNMTTCDSFYVRVMKSSANAVLFSDSGICGSMGALDSVANKSQYYYHNAVSAIDGAGAVGQYTLLVIGRKTTGASLYTANAMTFQIAPWFATVSGDTTNAGYLRTDVYSVAATAQTAADVGALATAIRDTVNVVLDTLQLQDGWAAKEASVTIVRDTLALYDTRFDSLLAFSADANTQVKNRLLRIRDTVDNILDTLQLHDNWVAGSTLLGLVRDTVNATLDTLQLHDIRIDSLLAASSDAKIKTQVNQVRDTILLYDTRFDSLLAASADAKIKTQVNQIRDTILLYDTRFDSLLAFAADANTQVKNRLLRVRDSIDVILDSIQNHDNWAATLANQTLIKDTVNASLDSLQLYDGRWALADTVNAVLDTLQNGSSTIRSTAAVSYDSIYAILDTLQNESSTLRGGGAATLPDSVSNMVTIVNRVRDTVNALLDTLQVTDTRWDSLLAVSADANTQFKNRLLRIRDTVDKIMDTLQLYDGRWALADTANAILDTLQNASSGLRGGAATLPDSVSNVVTIVNRVRDTVNAILDTLQVTDTRWDSTLAVSADANTQFKNRLLRVRDTVDGIMDTLQNHDNWVARADTLNAVIDTLQNAGSDLRGGGTATVDTAAIARSVWDNDVVALADRRAFLDTVTDYRIIARVIHDSLGIITLTAVTNDTAGGAGDFVGSFAEYRKAIKRKCGIDMSNTAWLPDSTMNDFVKEAVAAVNPIVMGRKIIDTIASILSQENTYEIDSNMIGVFSVAWRNGDSVKSLVPVPRTLWHQQPHQTTIGQIDGYLKYPSYYDFIDGYVSVFPVPRISGDTVGDTLNGAFVVTGWSLVPDLTSGASISLIPQQYRATILEYATWKVAEAKQHPLAAGFRSNFFELLSRMDVMLNGRVPEKGNTRE